MAQIFTFSNFETWETHENVSMILLIQKCWQCLHTRNKSCQPNHFMVNTETMQNSHRFSKFRIRVLNFHMMGTPTITTTVIMKDLRMHIQIICNQLIMPLNRKHFVFKHTPKQLFGTMNVCLWNGTETVLRDFRVGCHFRVYTFTTRHCWLGTPNS